MADSEVPPDPQPPAVPSEPQPPTSAAADQAPRARGKGTRPAFAYGTAPALVTDAEGAVVDLVRDAGAADEEVFEAARRQLDAGELGAARETFRALAVAQPRVKRYRLYMHYAWGREHQAARRPGEARSELERALRIDPDFAPAREALAGLEARQGWLSRLFGKRK